MAGDLPPPHRRTGFPQPPATLLPPNHARQACGPAARPARRSAAPRQQQQPGLRAASSSSAQRGQIMQAPDFLAQTWAHCAMHPRGPRAAPRANTRCDRGVADAAEACLSRRPWRLASRADLPVHSTSCTRRELTAGVVSQAQQAVDSSREAAAARRRPAALQSGPSRAPQPAV